ncbi:hypothetical protein J6590_005233 [Homalodisca vitripennis]|nr:hypothetical protein J6590_005233 [Homalodisca vitripennis]
MAPRPPSSTQMLTAHVGLCVFLIKARVILGALSSLWANQMCPESSVILSIFCHSVVICDFVRACACNRYCHNAREYDTILHTSVVAKVHFISSAVVERLLLEFYTARKNKSTRVKYSLIALLSPRIPHILHTSVVAKVHFISSAILERLLLEFYTARKNQSNRVKYSSIALLSPRICRGKVILFIRCSGRLLYTLLEKQDPQSEKITFSFLLTIRPDILPIGADCNICAEAQIENNGREFQVPTLTDGMCVHQTAAFGAFICVSEPNRVPTMPVISTPHRGRGGVLFPGVKPNLISSETRCPLKLIE